LGEMPTEILPTGAGFLARSEAANDTPDPRIPTIHSGWVRGNKRSLLKTKINWRAAKGKFRKPTFQ